MVLLGAIAACSDGDAAPTTEAGGSVSVESTEPPSTAAPTTEVTTTIAEVVATEPPGVQPEGFTTATVRVTKADGEVCEFCMWLADDGGERGRGLMGVTDLGEPVGMAFLYDSAIDGSFFMFRTPTPLSIAWFGADGSYVSSTDMTPCMVENSADCERYRAGAPFVLAIEVFQGGLEELGITPGSSAVIVAGTESAECVISGDPA
ncbi:MAG: DUF192 domain-containing protein [Ilumatobacteraceae bacterium]